MIVRQILGFIYRDWHLTRRYWSWVVVFTAYALVSSATVALIGVAAKDVRLTITLTVGTLLWSYLGVLFNEIAMSIAFERWEGTLEYTFMAPVSRVLHMSGVSLFAVSYALFRSIFVLAGLMLFLSVSFRGANFPGLMVILAVSSFAFVGLGLIAATLPVMSPERGAEATNIFQSVLLLVSGIYYPVSVLPGWLQPLAALSPATYALSAARKLMGVDRYSGSGPLPGAPLSEVMPEIGILLLMGVVLVPAGFGVFSLVENWAKRTGKLKRTG